MPAATRPAVSIGPNVRAKPAPPPASVPISTRPAFTRMEFSRDYEAGTKDRNGLVMGGTETMRFSSTRASSSPAWTTGWTFLMGTRPASKPPWTGPQVLVKESAAGPWRVDISFPYAIRLEAMISATFVTDGSGRKLDPPVKLLVASPSARNTAAWTRNDVTGKWTRIMVAEGCAADCDPSAPHVDKVTGVQYLFGGASTFAPDASFGSIFRAVYDPAAGEAAVGRGPGAFRDRADHVHCAEADGVLYAAGGIKDEDAALGRPLPARGRQ